MALRFPLPSILVTAALVQDSVASCLDHWSSLLIQCFPTLAPGLWTLLMGFGLFGNSDAWIPPQRFRFN